jgi:hypothetical protein
MNKQCVYTCKLCNFECTKKYNYKSHLSTMKHINAYNACYEKYACIYCDKRYKARNGLWYHLKKCELNPNKQQKTQVNNEEDPEIEESIELKEENSVINISDISENIANTEMLVELIKQNKELQQTLVNQSQTIIELSKKVGNHTTIHNKTFNLNVFLNETCKDAINLRDFVDQIKLTIDDLEETGKLGYAEGLSKVFIKNLNELQISERPIHCSDLKRETIFIKDSDKWEKEDEQKTKLKHAIKTIAHKNIMKIHDWQNLYPKFNDPESNQSDKYLKIVLNSMSGSTKEEADKNYCKIVKNIAKSVIIDR